MDVETTYQATQRLDTQRSIAHDTHMHIGMHIRYLYCSNVYECTIWPFPLWVPKWTSVMWTLAYQRDTHIDINPVTITVPTAVCIDVSHMTGPEHMIICVCIRAHMLYTQLAIGYNIAHGPYLIRNSRYWGVRKKHTVWPYHPHQSNWVTPHRYAQHHIKTPVTVVTLSSGRIL